MERDSILCSKIRGSTLGRQNDAGVENQFAIQVLTSLLITNLESLRRE